MIALIKKLFLSFLKKQTDEVKKQMLDEYHRNEAIERYKDKLRRDHIANSRE